MSSAPGGSRLSLWSTDSLLSIGSRGSGLPSLSRWSLLADRSFGSALSSRSA